MRQVSNYSVRYYVDVNSEKPGTHFVLKDSDFDYFEEAYSCYIHMLDNNIQCYLINNFTNEIYNSNIEVL